MGHLGRRGGACHNAYPDVNDVLEFVLLLQWVEAVRAHDLWLQHITCAPIQTEEGAVQLGVFIWEEQSGESNPQLKKLVKRNHKHVISHV